MGEPTLDTLEKTIVIAVRQVNKREGFFSTRQELKLAQRIIREFTNQGITMEQDMIDQSPEPNLNPIGSPIGQGIIYPSDLGHMSKRTAYTRGFDSGRHIGARDFNVKNFALGFFCGMAAVAAVGGAVVAVITALTGPMM